MFVFFLPVGQSNGASCFHYLQKGEVVFERQLPARVHYFVSGSPEQQSTARPLHLGNEGKGVFDLYFSREQTIRTDIRNRILKCRDSASQSESKHILIIPVHLFDWFFKAAAPNLFLHHGLVYNQAVFSVSGH